MKKSLTFFTIWQWLRHVNLTIISLFCISQSGQCHFEVKLWTTHKYGCLWQLTFLISGPVNVSYVKKYWYFLLFDCIWDTSIWPSSLCFVFDNWDNAILKPKWISFLLQLFSMYFCTRFETHLFRIWFRQYIYYIFRYTKSWTLSWKAWYFLPILINQSIGIICEKKKGENKNT